MSARRTLLLGLFLSTPMPLLAQELPAGFGWFRDMVGHCWTGRMPDGTSQHTHCYGAQFGRFIRGSAMLATAKDGGPPRTVFEGDSVFAWDEAAGQIVYTLWGSDGSHRRLDAQWLGEELSFPIPARAEPQRV